MTINTVIFLSQHRPMELWTALSCAITEVESGQKVLILDISQFSYPSLSPPPLWFCRLMGFDHVMKDLSNFFEKRGVSYFCLRSSASDLGQEIDTSELTMLQLSSISSTRSLLRRRDKQRFDLLWQVFSRNKLRLARRQLMSLRSLPPMPSGTRWFIPNGRHPHQTAAKLYASQQASGSLVFYDRATSDYRKIFLSDVQMHDRVGRQKFLSSVMDTASEDEVNELWDSHLAYRVNSQSSNSGFASGWRSLESKEFSESDQFFALFSSSTEELAECHPSFDEPTWETQFEGFEHVVEEIRRSYPDASFGLRLHPNLANKGIHEVNQVRKHLKALKSLGVTVIGPLEPVNSYGLVERSIAVIVSQSSMGIEAMLLGKPVISVTPNLYDLSLPVTKYWTQADGLEINSIIAQDSAWLRSQALKYLFAVRTQDVESKFGDSDVVSWDSWSPKSRKEKLMAYLEFGKGSFWFRCSQLLLKLEKSFVRILFKKLPL